MNWENLKDKKCPHCSCRLTDKPEEDGLIHCTQCRFSISQDKFRAVLLHRGKTGFTPAIKMRWQNLHEGRCPVCSSFLKNADQGYYEIQECSASACDFRIRDDRMKEILEDPSHVANVFYKKLDDDIDKNLGDLNNL